MSDGVTTTPAGLSVDVDIDTPTAQQPGAGGESETLKLYRERIPQEYHNEEWFSNFAKTADPLAEMAKGYHNQQSLIGRKAEGIRVPGEGATSEDWGKFYKEIGVPETPDKYEYKAPEVNEKLKPYVQQDEAFINLMKQAALKAGVRPEGFNHLSEAWNNHFVGEIEKAVNANTEMLGKLENNFKAKFGERSNQVLTNWQNSMTSLGKEHAAVMENLDPAVKVILAEHYDSVSKKYIREDNLDLGAQSGGSGAMNEAEYAEEYARVFAKIRKHSPGSPDRLQAESEMKSLQARGKNIFK